MDHRSCRSLHGIILAVMIAATCVCVTPRSSAADLPKATVKLLAELELPPDILAGLDQELTVPAEWIEGARKEGALRMGATWDPPQYRKMTEPFVERYPSSSTNIRAAIARNAR